MVVFEKSRRGNEHPGRTRTALGGSVAQKSVLQAIEQRRTAGESLNGCYFCAFGLGHGNKTGADRVSVDKDGACAAIAGVAANLRTSESEVLAQNAGEAPHRGRSHGDRLTVDCEGKPRFDLA
jgi:hypothetical protein